MSVYTFVTIASVAPARAIFIEIGVVTPSDGFATWETTGNLVWLDVTQTVGLSYNDIIAGAGGWLSAGWRYATGGELCSLFGVVTSVQSQAPCPRPAGAPWVPGEGASGEVEVLVALLGVTDAAFSPATAGTYDDGDPAGAVGSAVLSSAGFLGTPSSSGVFDDFLTPDFSHPTQGHWLVKEFVPVPEASCAAMLATGLLILVRRSWRA
ncbi:MAG: hypothetical protein GY937_20720 [bacterium]|nr:hypothetical protein [bacterium]